MTEPAISIESISKRYTIGQMPTVAGSWQKSGRKEVPGDRDSSDILWALKDVSFEVKKGEVLGVVGRNGAGKSTLLKILSRITDPTEGRAIIRGRIGSLLEVGTGFHPELTGRENVFLNGSILGMSRREIEARFDDIVEFSEIGRFLDTPVKRYSSGMFTRLAFAVAANLDPEILIIDEVLSVGDAAFQKKCLTKINTLMRSGRTIIFVSHSMGSVSELCQSGVLLHQGRLLHVGPVNEVIGRYTELLSQSIVQGDVAREKDGLSVKSILIANSKGLPSNVFDVNEEIELTIEYSVLFPLETLQVSVLVARNLAEIISTFDTDELAEPLVRREPGVYQAKLRLPARFLKAGAYTARVGLGTIDKHMIDIEGAVQFTVEELSESTTYRGWRAERLGHVICPGTWHVTKLS